MEKFLFTNRTYHGVNYNGRTILALAILILVAVALPLSFLTAQVDQGNVELKKHYITADGIILAKDSIYFARQGQICSS
jgi:hypothetical protein